MSDAIPEDNFDPFARSTVVIVPPPGQRELWLATQSGTEASLAYNESFSVELKGSVDDEALLAALRALPDVHETLRGHFSEEGEQFIMEPRFDLEVPVHDLTKATEETRTNELVNAERRAAETVYDLNKGPLFRAEVFLLSAQRRVVFFGGHHTVSDGWSLDVLLYDLGRLYTGFATHTLLPLPPLKTYADYAQRATSEAQRAAVQKSLDFWKQRCSPLPTALTLPHDGERPALRTFAARHATQSWGVNIVAPVKDWARAEGVSFFAVLLAAYATTIHRISGADDFVVGIPVAGHPEADMEDVVGHMANLVPVRFTFSPDVSFKALAHTTHTALLDAREHASVGFGEIVAALKVPRDPSRVPLITSIFTHVQKYSTSKLRFADLEVAYHLVPRAFETFEWNINAVESPQGLEILSHANADLFSQWWLDQRLEDFQRLLVEGCRSAEVPLASLSLRTLAETETQIAHETTSTLRTDFLNLTPIELFQRTVKTAPDAPALRFAGRDTSFRLLDLESDRVAAELVAAGVSPGAFVGLYVDRGPRLLQGILGIWKAGAAYVPLDPHFPSDRLKMVIEDSGMTLIATETLRQSDALFQGLSTNQYLLDAPIADHRAVPSALAVAANPAYMLFTSGSTGRPKGVPITHGSLSNLLLAMKEAPGVHAGDRVLALTTASFDISCLELYLPLLCAGTVVLVDDETALDPTAIAALIDAEKITFLQTTPSRMTLLTESGWRPHRGMRVILGGEAFTKTLAARLLESGAEIWNGYGPTETTVYSSTHRVTDATRDVPIGRPIANTRFYVLDASHRLLPPGVPGELGIGGAGLSPGYHNRPDLNQDRFITLGHAERVYRTGDLVQTSPEGDYRYLGRMDFQVKIRGFRVELGEIENTMARFPGVLEAVCSLWTRSESDKRLIGYYRAETPVDEAGLQSFLKKHLTDYMVPHHFVAMREFPKTPSDKIDRKAFPLPSDSALSASKAEVVPPRSPSEAGILEIWQRVLDQDGFGVTESFFELGGHSMLATRLVREMNQELGMNLTLRDLFERPTVEGLALHAPRTSGTLPLVFAAKESGHKTPLFLVSGVYTNHYHEGDGDSLWVQDFLRYFSNIISLVGQDRRIFGLRPRGIFRGERFHSNVKKMASEYISEIQKIQPQGPYLIGGECLGGNVAYEIARQLQANGAEVKRLILLDTHRENLVHETRYQWGELLNKLRDAKRDLSKSLKNGHGFWGWLGDCRRYLVPLSAQEREFRDLEWGAFLHQDRLLRYRPKHYTGPVVVLTNEEWHQERPDLGWKKDVCPQLEVRVIPGDHETRLTTHGKVLAKALQDSLGEH